MINDGFDLARETGKRLNDEHHRFQSFVDETLDQMEAKRVALEGCEKQLHLVQQRLVSNQEAMDRALAAVHGREIMSDQRQRMSRLAEQLTVDRETIEDLESRISSLRSDMDGAMEDFNVFADVLVMVDTLKTEFKNAQSEYLRVQGTIDESDVELSQHPLVNRLRQSYEEVERLTNVVERHRKRLAYERETYCR